MLAGSTLERCLILSNKTFFSAVKNAAGYYLGPVMQSITAPGFQFMQSFGAKLLGDSNLWSY